MNTRRKITSTFFETLMKLSAFLIVAVLLYILGTILYKGIPSLSWEMISQKPSAGFYMGGGGGILNAIVGSIYLAGGASLFALFFSLPLVIYINNYAKKNGKFVQVIRLIMDVLYGIPSIVYGTFGFVIMLALGWTVSLLAGIITVGIFVFPILVRSMDEVLRTVPPEVNQAAYSLGATRLETSVFVSLRQAMPGILAGFLLSFGRAIGDAASVLFTAGFTDNIPTSLTQPAATLPLSIFFQLGSPFEEVRNRAYAAAVVLTVIILIISILSRLVMKHFSKYIIK
ncbi:MAG: phosphate transporter, permease protein PstA [Bacteroidota bacterium]|nr:phosphate transporter, permease protein PstA [Bacteroidota bacterium]